MPELQDRIRPTRVWLNQTPLGAIDNSVISGTNMYIRTPGVLEPWRGMTGPGAAGRPTMMLVGQTYGGLTSGTIILYRGGTVWFIGSGSMVYGGSPAQVNGASATSVLQLYLASGGGPFPAGLSRPTLPNPTSLVATSGGTKMNGTYSVKVTRLRTETGAESNASEASNVVACGGSQNRVTLTFGSVAVAEGQNGWGIYGSRRGFGATGNWYHLQDVTWTGTPPTSQVLEWYDGDLGEDLAPFDYNPARTATNGFCFALGNVMVYHGGFGEGSLSPSIPGKPEAFPASYTVFLNPLEAPVAIKGRATDGWQYILCRNSLQAAFLTPSSSTPIIPRAIWTEVGFPSSKAACLVHSELYGYTLQRGPVRTSQTSDPDTTYAFPVVNRIAQWDSSTVGCGYSPADDAVVFYGTNGGQNEALAYFRQSDVWSLPLQLPNGTLGGCVTYGGQLYITVGGAQYQFNTGGGATGSAFFAWRDMGAGDLRKTLTSMVADVRGPVTLKLYRNLDESTPLATVTVSTADQLHSALSKLNIRDCRTYALEVSGVSSGSAFYGAHFIAESRETLG